MTEPRRRLRPLLLGLVVLAADAAILIPALLWSRSVVPAWKKGPLIDPAAPYAPENAIVLAAVALCIALDVYALGLFFAQRRLGRRAWLPALLLLLSLGAAEGSLRAWLAVDMVTYFRPHPTLHWQVRPHLQDFHQEGEDPSSGTGLITTNGDGMREVDLPRTKAADELRVLVLGDSSNFGHGVDGHEMWSSVLEELLEDRVEGRRVRVLNGACPGWTTYQALVFLDEIGLAYEPDVVVAGFNNDPGPDYLGDAQRLTPEPQRSINGVLWRSELYLLAREAVLATVRRLRPTAYQHYSARDAGQDPKYGKLGEEESAGLVPRVPREDFLANLRALHALGLERGYRFVWIDMPINRSQPQLVERYVNPGYRHGAELLAEELGFPVVQADRAFRAHPPGRLHLPRHVFHPDPRGHRLLAELVAHTLKAEGVIDGIGPLPPPSKPPPAGATRHPRESTEPGRLRFGCSSLTPIHAHVAVVLQEHPQLVEEAGLELELELFASGKTQGEAVAQGQLQAYFTCGVPAVHMLESGPQARTVGSPGELGRIAVVARRDAATELSDLAGARVGLAEGSTPAMEWQVWGEGLGATVVPTRTEALEDALLAGEIDAAVSWDPWVERWLHEHPDELVVLAERPFWSLLALDLGWTGGHPDQAAAVVGLVERALAIAAADRERYDRLVAELSGWPLEVVKAVADRNRILSGQAEARVERLPEAREELERAARYTHGPLADPAGLFAPLPGDPSPPTPGSGDRTPAPPEAAWPGEKPESSARH